MMQHSKTSFALTILWAAFGALGCFSGEQGGPGPSDPASEDPGAGSDPAPALSAAELSSCQQGCDTLRQRGCADSQELQGCYADCSATHGEAAEMFSACVLLGTICDPTCPDLLAPVPEGDPEDGGDVEGGGGDVEGGPGDLPEVGEDLPPDDGGGEDNPDLAGIGQPCFSASDCAPPDASSEVATCFLDVGTGYSECLWTCTEAGCPPGWSCWMLDGEEYYCLAD